MHDSCKQFGKACPTCADVMFSENLKAFVGRRCNFIMTTIPQQFIKRGSSESMSSCHESGPPNTSITNKRYTHNECRTSKAQAHLKHPFALQIKKCYTHNECRTSRAQAHLKHPFALQIKIVTRIMNVGSPGTRPT